MSDQDIRDLWAQINDVKANQALHATLLAEIKSMLTERCSTREKRMERLEANQKEQGRRHDSLERRMDKVETRIAVFSAIGGIVGAILGVIGSQVAASLFQAVAK